MDKYLAVTTTVLIISQVIRIIQNAINLHRQRIAFERDVKHLKDIEVSKEDFALQKKCYRLIVAKLEREMWIEDDWK